MANLSHWATIAPHLPGYVAPGMPLLPTWVQGEDQIRVAAYDAYEAIYWTAPKSFQISMYGQDSQPIYVPSGRKIVETAHRYLAPQMRIQVDPAFGDDNQRTDAQALILDFIRRERLYSKFSAEKRNGLMKGDSAWHIFADPEREEGSRISIFPLDPATYFPEYADGDDVTQVVAVHLAEVTLDDKGDPAVRKLVYRKETETGGPSPIIMYEAICPVDEWGQPGTDMVETISKLLIENELPAPIDHIPVYHIPNLYEPTFGWGSSEMRGIEVIMGAINQGITDEQLTLALEGLGVYVTDAGQPVNKEGQPVAWNLGPARVVEVPLGKKFDRVNGVGDISPYLDHLRYLQGQMDDTLGANDVTRGQADVAVAESGIALAIRMGPMLSRIGEKELILTDVTMNMLFDLRNWFTAYEGLNLEPIRWLPTYGEKLPIDKARVFKEIIEMYTATPPLISGKEARKQLTDIGYVLPEDSVLFADIMKEQSDYAGAMADAEASRILGATIDAP